MGNHQLHLTAIAGGIGSGKSVVCRILVAMGYEVYDCDSRAKKLMDVSDGIKDGIERDICAEAIKCSADGGRIIDRRALSEAVFSDAILLERLNRLVHGEVKSDILRWKNQLASTNSYKRPRAFVETAILYESGLYTLVDDAWIVSAPDPVRLERACVRDNASREQILARMESQRITSACARDSVKDEESLPLCHQIINDGHMAVIPQILQLLNL